MNYLKDSAGHTIVIPDNVLLFKGIVSFLNFAIRGEYTTDFQVPNDSDTRSVMEFYGINQVNKVVEKPFDLYIDGNKISRGRVVVRGVSEVFDMFYIGGNANWMNRITGTLKDLDLSGYDVSFDAQTVIERMSATDGIIFPVIDWAYNFKKLSNKFLVTPISGVSIDTFYDFYPCFHVHTLIKKIFTSRGIICAGNLFDDPVFNAIVITPEEIRAAAFASPNNLDAQVSMGVEDACQQLGTNSLQKVNFESGTSPNYDDTNDRLTFPDGDLGVTIEYSLRATSNLNCALNSPFVGTVYLYQNGAPVHSVTRTSGSLEPMTGTYQTAVAPGDYFELYFIHQLFQQRIRDASVTISTSGTGFTNQRVFVKEVVPALDQFNFVKSYAMRFNCLIDFDEVTQTIYFNMMDRIRKEDAQDLTDKMVAYEQVPSSGYGALNYLRTTEADELKTYLNESLNYGDAVVESDGGEEQDVFKTLLRPAESFVNQNLEWLQTRVPLVLLEDADTGNTFTHAVDGGGYVSHFANFSILNPTYVVGEVLRVESTLYNGFIVVEGTDYVTYAGSVIPYGNVPFVGSIDGKIYKQKVVFPSVGSRELIVVRGISVNDINTGSQVYGSINLSVDQFPIDSIAFAYYAKPNIGTAIDFARIGLNYGPVINTGNMTFGDAYHKLLRKIITGSRLPARFVMSQTDYENLRLNEFIYLRTKGFEGYFLMDTIEGYRNPYTEVEANLISID